MEKEEIKKLVENEKDIKELLEIHLGKQKKVDIFYDIIKKNVKNGKFERNSFNPYGFFFGAFYLLYRKLYLYAISLFALSIVLEFLNIDHTVINVGISVAIAAISNRLYIDKFFKDVKKAGYKEKNFEEVKKNLSKYGGYNNWAIFFGILIAIFSISPIILDDQSDYLETTIRDEYSQKNDKNILDINDYFSNEDEYISTTDFTQNLEESFE